MKRFYISLFIITLVIPSFAQVTFIAPSKSVSKGDVFGADIRVKTKDTISALQFTFEWNPSVLEFRSVDGITLPLSGDDLFGLTAITQGNLKFLWLSSASDGLKIADSSVIFQVNFKAIGEKGTTSGVKFTNSIIKVKALNPRIESLPVVVKDGLITVSMTSALNDLTDNKGLLSLLQNQPNPVYGITYIPFELKEPDRISFEVYDSIGRQVFQRKDNYSAGKHQIEFNTEGVLKRGMYLYGIKTSKGFTSKTLIKM
jgi:Cohesin domain/Secretion system C-terminal sorting domain